jgi:MFS family permease
MSMRNPWWIVVGSVLGLIVGNGPIMQFTFGVLLKPISEEFKWDRATVSSAIVVGLCMTGLMTPVVGGIVDRRGIRPIALPAITLFALAVAAVSLVPASAPLFIALYAVMGIFAAGQTPLIYAKSISANFDERRGLALPQNSSRRRCMRATNSSSDLSPNRHQQRKLHSRSGARLCRYQRSRYPRLFLTYIFRTDPI